ncbi:hypothetical protein ABPG74_022498 [Tetrahymena malaccensis]
MKFEDQNKTSLTEKQIKQQQADPQISFGEDYVIQENQSEEAANETTDNDKCQQIQFLKDEIQKYKNIIQLMSKKIKFLEDQLQPKNLNSQQNKFSQIIKNTEIGLISEWLTQGEREVSLQPIYQATSDGFQIEKIYEKCSELNNLLVVVQTDQNKRFGFFTDLEIKDNGYQFIYQNPNKIFLFSLDLKKKYSSNKRNCEHAFYSNNSYFSVGLDDIKIYTNSDKSYKSLNNFGCYGEKEGIKSTGFLNGGSREFKTVEIEIFKVVYH